MHKTVYTFSEKIVTCYFAAGIADLPALIPAEDIIIIADENMHRLHTEKIAPFKSIIIPPGEAAKQPSIIQYIIHELIKLEANRNTILVGIGGGVVTDITGYTASIYMRGIRFAFIPTTLLAMVDASIGGKNGVDVGIYKNIIGVIRQPDFLLFDYTFLDTLPEEEWINGFAEIIKHGCIKDKPLFEMLEQESLQSIKTNPIKLAALIERNVAIKSNIVMNDEFENGERKLLNFGHTFGHAVENMYNLSHGRAVSIGIVQACKISVELNDFPAEEMERIIALLRKFHLPVDMVYNKIEVWNILKMDKKRAGNNIGFVLLSHIGDSMIRNIPIVQLEDLVEQVL